LEEVARSLGMKVLDLSMLKVGSNAQNKLAIEKCQLIITDEWDPTKISKQLMVKSVDASKI
jgi:hypothetical protein